MRGDKKSSLGRQWSKKRIVILNCTGMVQHGVVLLLMGPVLPEMMKTFSITESLAGIMLGLSSLGFMSAPVVAGAITDRYGVKSMLLAGLILETVFLCLIGFSPLFIWAIITTFFLKFGAGFLETSLNVVPTLVESRQRGSLMNLVHLFFSVGALASPLLVGLLLQAFGSWRPIFLLIALPTSVLTVVVLITVFPHRKLPRKSELRLGQTWKSIFVDRSVILGALVLFLYVGAEMAASNWIVLYLQRKLQFSTLTSTMGLSILWIGIMVGRYLNSLLAHSRSSRELVVGAGIGGLLFGLALLTARTPLTAYLLLGALGLCMSGIFPNVMAELNARDPSRTGSVTGFLTVAAAAGAAVTQPIVGMVAQWMGLRAALTLPGILMGLLVVIYLGVAVEKE